MKPMLISCLLVVGPLLLASTSSAAIVAYDCRAEEINKTAISLVQLPDCSSSHEKPLITKVQVVVSQTEQKRKVNINRCLLTASNLVFRCGKWLGADTPVDSYTQVLRVSREDCERLMKDGVMGLPGGMGDSVQFKGPGKYSHSYWSWGGFSGSSCNPGPTLTVEGKSYERAVRRTNLELTYTEATAMLEVDTGRLVFANGERCDYNQEHCETAEYGNIYWRRTVPVCTSDVPTVTVYKGLGELVRVQDRRNATVEYIQVSHQGYDFQIKLESGEKASVCGYPSHFTEHPDLFVTIMDSSSPPFPDVREVDAENVNLMSYINTKLVYAMRHTKEQVDSLYELFHQERCNMQNRITQNLQTLALLSPREFAYQYFGKPGYTAVARGEAIYAAQCKAVAVTPSPLKNVCYNELVVTYRNETWFMTPRTRILIPEGTIITCSAEFSPIYLLGNKWVSQNSLGLTEVPRPTVITTEEIHYEFDTMNNLVNGGLYTPEILKAYQRILTSPMEEAVIMARVTDSLRGGSQLPSGYSFTQGLTESDFAMLNDKVGWLSWAKGWAMNIIYWFAGFWFVIWIICAMISLVNCCVQFRFLREDRGFFPALFVSLFSSVSYLMLSGKWAERKNQNPLEQPMVRRSAYVTRIQARESERNDLLTSVSVA